MADKLVAIRIKQQNNTYSNEIPIGAWAENVAYDNTKNLLQVLGTIDMYKGDVQTQLNALFENFNNIAEDITRAIDNWIADNMPSWNPEDHLDFSLASSTQAAAGSAVPKLIAINEADVQGTKMKISTTGQQDLTVLTPSDIDNTLSQQGEAADAKATGEMIMINNAATAGTKIRLITTDEDVSLVTTNGQPFIMRKINAQVKDPNTGEMIPAGILSSDSITQITAAENSAITRITNEKTSAVNAVTAAGTAAAANFPATAAACDTLAGDFAATYVPDQAYAVGDYCTYQYQLYQCKTAIAANTDHTFVTSHWNLITVTDTINDQVDDLKESCVKKNGENEVTPKNLQIVETQEGKNLLNLDAVTHGYYMSKSGITQRSETMFYSDFIPVEQGENYVFSHRNISSGNTGSSTIRFVACYDENKTIMPNAGSNEIVTQPYEIPSGVYWIRISTYYNAQDEYQFEKGDTYTEYHPYGWAINIIKREYLPENLSELTTDNKTSLVSAINEVNEGTESNTEFIEEIRNKITHHESTNHYNDETKVVGRLNVDDGSIDTTATTVSTTDWIPVRPGTIVRTAYVNNSNVLTVFAARFVAYTAEKEYISGVPGAASFTVPENAKYIRVGIANSYLAYPVAITFNTEISEYTYEPYFEEYNTYTEDFITEETKRKLDEINIFHDTPYINNSNTLSGSDALRVAVPHAKRNYTISFRGKITTFGKITVGIGKASAYLSGWVEIDSTNIYVYTKRGTTEVLAGTYAHGLTFSETINVDIHATSILSCEVVLSTVGGMFKTQSNWFGCLGFSFIGFEGRVTAETDGGVFTDCSIAYYCADYKKDIWGFGDSYFDHWPRIAVENNYDNFAIDGASGRHSDQAWHSLELESQKRLPKKILWCMGMNDYDTASSVNTLWKTYYDKLTAFCDTHNIELILCTIPCVPERNNSFKNQIIRDSGYRYVDIADAVGGTEPGSTWYPGLLEPNDNAALRVHPTNAGDKVVAARFMTDVPELMN